VGSRFGEQAGGDGDVVVAAGDVDGNNARL
jgi:hypothetical protein